LPRYSSAIYSESPLHNPKPIGDARGADTLPSQTLTPTDFAVAVLVQIPELISHLLLAGSGEGVAARFLCKRIALSKLRASSAYSAECGAKRRAYLTIWSPRSLSRITATLSWRTIPLGKAAMPNAPQRVWLTLGKTALLKAFQRVWLSRESSRSCSAGKA
jgi:hypothetical protein